MNLAVLIRIWVFVTASWTLQQDADIGGARIHDNTHVIIALAANEYGYRVSLDGGFHSAVPV